MFLNGFCSQVCEEGDFREIAHSRPIHFVGKRLAAYCLGAWPVGRLFCAAGARPQRAAVAAASIDARFGVTTYITNTVA